MRWPLLWESWQSTQDPFTTGTCCCKAADFSWQAKQICSLGIARLSVVMSPWVCATWQTVHEAAIAECTERPVICLAWQELQSAF